jgi:hypothetical protein
MKNTTPLTEKETVLFNACVAGMDAPNEGWLHEIAARAGIDDDRSLSGLVSSLVKKGMIYSEVDPGEYGMSDAYWITVADA